MIVTIVGRENVGKSTLFNKLCKGNKSIVGSEYGITRDYLQEKCKFFDIEFDLVDTAGWFIRKKTNTVFDKKIKDNVLSVMSRSSVILFVVDVKSAIANEDLILLKEVRKLRSNSVILVANKSESKKILKQEDLLIFGLGEPVYVSAEHSEGFADLYNAILPFYKKSNKEVQQPNKRLSIAIIGRPNVGKSTIFNKILGFERNIVSDIAGTTRDHVGYKIKINERDIELIDTAGARKKSKINQYIEELSVKKSIEAIKNSDIVLIIMDSSNMLEKQDLNLINTTIKQNKLPILIINKSDLINDKTSFHSEVEHLISKKVSQIKGIPVIYIAAKLNLNISKLFFEIFRFWDIFNKKVSTSKLNSWWKSKREFAPKGVKIKYISQSGFCPPSFSFFTNISTNLEIPDNFKRFLMNSLMEEFDMHGIPIKMKFVRSKNPFMN